MNLRATAVAALALVLLAGTGAVGAQEAPPARTGLGIRLAEAPTSMAKDPRAQSSVIDHVQPGDSFRRRIEVGNGDPEPMEVDAYVAAASIEGSRFTIGDRAARGRITSWARIEPAEVTLAPGEKAQLQLVVDVPADAPDGEYYGAAVAAVLGEEVGGIRNEARVAVKIYLSVGEGAPPASDFEVTGLQASRAEDRAPVVTAQVRNTGGRALDMVGELELEDGPAGLSAGPFPAELGQTLAIGASSAVRVVLDPETPAGPWDAVLTLRSGQVEHAVEARIRFPDETGERAEVAYEEVTEAKRLPAFVAGVLVACVLVALFAISQLRGRLRRRRLAD